MESNAYYINGNGFLGDTTRKWFADGTPCTIHEALKNGSFIVDIDGTFFWLPASRIRKEKEADNIHPDFKDQFDKLKFGDKVLSLRERWDLTQKLGGYMSVGSQDYICAGWVIGWEDIVARAYASDALIMVIGDEELRNIILELHEKLGHWAAYTYDKTGSWYAIYLDAPKGGQ